MYVCMYAYVCLTSGHILISMFSSVKLQITVLTGKHADWIVCKLVNSQTAQIIIRAFF